MPRGKKIVAKTSATPAAYYKAAGHKLATRQKLKKAGKPKEAKQAFKAAGHEASLARAMDKLRVS